MCLRRVSSDEFRRCTLLAHIPRDADNSHYLWFKGHLVRLHRPLVQKTGSHLKEAITVTMFARNKSTFIELLAAAKLKFLDSNEGKLSIKAVDDRGSGWRQTALRHPRRLESVVTEDGGEFSIGVLGKGIF